PSRRRSRGCAGGRGLRARPGGRRRAAGSLQVQVALRSQSPNGLAGQVAAGVPRRRRGSRTDPGGGSAAALVTALAAALLAKIARTSTAWPDSSGVAAQAESLRDRAAPLAQTTAEEYEAALQAREDEGEAGERRD